MFHLIYFFIFIFTMISIPCKAYSQSVMDNGTPASIHPNEIKKYIDNAVNEGNARLLSNILPQIQEIVKGERAAETSTIQKNLDDIINELNIQKNQSIKNKADAKLAFDKAQKLADNGNIREAGFYYAVACASDPEEGLYVFGYVKAVLNWADRTAKRGKYDSAVSTLYDMEAFLYSGVSLIKPGNAENVAALIKEVASKINALKEEAGAKITAGETQSINLSIKNAYDILNINMPETVQRLEDYKAALENNIENIIRTSKGELSNTSKNTIKKIYEKIKSISDILEMEKYLKKGNELLDLVSVQKNHIYASGFLSEAAVIAQRLSLSADGISPDLRRRILKFGDNLTQASAKISLMISSIEFDKIQAKYNILIDRLNKGEINANQALKLIAGQKDEIASESSKITDSTVMTKTRELMTSLNIEIEKWQEIQVKRYEEWSVKTIRRFYDTYKNELGVLGSGSDTKDKIYAGMKDYLCPIEVRYLTTAGFKAYSEVFDYFYKELDRQRRLDLSSEFVNCEKRPLSYF